MLASTRLRAVGAAAARREFAVERAGGLLNALANVVLWARAAHEGLAPTALEHVQHAALTGTGLLLAWLSLRPESYRRQRLALIPALRLLLMSMPIARSATAYAAGLQLAGLPTPGLLGAATDAMRYLNGANLPGQCLITLLFPLPLPLSAATHVAVLWLTSNAEAFCGTPLLSHPLSRRRLSAAAAALDATAVVPLRLGGAAEPPPPPLEPQQRGCGRPDRCPEVLAFVHVATAVLPLVVQAWATSAPPRPAPRPGPRGAAARAWHGADAALRLAAASGMGWLLRLLQLFAVLLPLLWLVVREAVAGGPSAGDCL
ncbi:hypothetical protein Rsub_04918 [Raphidocelis subcapitata]|uniref:Uncharacterized protein n=1 Tax=Raphidocelis subcapitata TaxID=307507 RepID=A0A2V0P1U9_9CHLO|nr:hypothetical protein Rsub_04918 [Raphidocelis subcapitata]|eukprot:GBF91813.1 hypothetical protein Rsub_04918 [Raphidocelis subcapitata]